MKILWLASWYPNKISPLEGDFIQRHARAVSKFADISVIYVEQHGEAISISETNSEEIINEGVRELRVYFKFLKTGIKVPDKLIYNWKYYKTYRSVIKSYFDKNGLPDLIHVHVPMKAGIIAKWVQRKWGVPYLVSEHSATYVPGPPDSFENRSAWFRKNVRSIFRNAIAVTSVSQHDGDIIKKLFGLKSVSVIHNVVNTNNFFYAPKSLPAKFRFIHISIMSYQKNTIGILNACAKLKHIKQDWELELIGNTDDAMQQHIDALGLTGFVTLKGEISNAVVAKHMQCASAFVMFSRYENFPCVIIEALCCGLPVVATDVAGIPEAVNQTKGILVKSENEDQLVNAMNRMINEYTLFDRQIIAEDAVKKYNYDEIGKQFYKIYRTVITGTTPLLS
ncbi:MAG: glycosyltransferase [Agriterribacter sp.]